LPEWQFLRPIWQSLQRDPVLSRIASALAVIALKLQLLPSVENRTLAFAERGISGTE
jgi:hypothetical protein